MKTGIITFHAAHNYGAVLQAYSFQKALSDLEVDCEIIDFRRPEQIEYTSLYSRRKGLKSMVKNLMILPKHRERKKRSDKFDAFIENELIKSEKIYRSEAEVCETNKIYDVFFSGSDQIWNTKKLRDYSPAYFLDFVDEKNIKRYSYSTSIGMAEEKDLLEQKEMLKKYRKLSCREKRGVDAVSKLTNKEVELVLDPTLVVDVKYLKKYVKENPVNEPYLFYYSLDGFDKRKRNMDMIYALAAKFNLKVKMITPEWVYRGKKGEQCVSAGIEDFLTLIANAELVCTNSFHGTALSIKFRKSFYVLETYDGKDDRKKTTLELFDMSDRCISNLQSIENIVDYRMDYTNYLDKFYMHTEKSLEYLKACVEDSRKGDE